MSTRTLLIVTSLFLSVLVTASACSPAAAPKPAPALRAAPTQMAAAPAPTRAPAPTQAPAAKPATPQALTQAGVPDVKSAPVSEARMIIKNGDMTLLVANTDAAIDRATGIAVELGGYLVASKSWMQDDFKYASMTVGVPVDQFETAMRRMHGLAVQVLDENASGQDVTTEFVDLQSRMTNLEATAARIREFLKQAKDVDEALQVNDKLTQVTAEIEQVKGRMTYLKDRAAYSTLTLNLQPQRPTPTPTLTPTVTPTPTATPTSTPDVWRPEQTLKEASTTLVGMGRVTGDLVIWFVVVGIPCLAPLVGLGLIIRWATRRSRPRKPAPTQPRENAPHEPVEPPRLDA